MAIADYFLKNLDGIDGESTDDKHKNEIEVDSFSWGVTQSGTAGRTGTGRGAGKASIQDLHFTSKVNKASPKLDAGMRHWPAPGRSHAVYAGKPAASKRIISRSS